MKKCIVLDLDNTLWGGVVGEDGPNGIALSTTVPGAYYIAFQQALLDLTHQGIILAINSANNPEEALHVIEKNPNMILKRGHFAAERINWEDKVENMRSLAQELNIGLDSFVFLDDDPRNRAAMREFLPEVGTPEMPTDPSGYVQLLHSLPYFESDAITDEDKMRGNMYVTERLRREAEKSFGTKEEFLRSLGLRVHMFENEASSLERLSQLSGKTNQFNTNKNPLSAEELKKFIDDPRYSVFFGRVTDRFGDYGITAFALVKKQKDEWIIESLLLSCRVIGRGVEDAFLSSVAKRAVAEKVPAISVKFVQTEKNAPAKEFVDRHFKNGRIETRAIQSPAWVQVL